MRSFRVRLLAASFVLLSFAGCGPNDGVKELEQGKAAYEIRDLKKAEKLFDKSLSLAPQSVERILYLARVKLDLGELVEAMELTERASALEDDATDVKFLVGQVAWHSKDYKRAEDCFSAVANNVELDAALRAQGWSALGVVKMTCDSPDLARIAFLRAIRLDRRNASAWYHLGLLYRDSFGYLEAALEQFNIFVRLEEEASPRVQKVQRTVIPALKEQIAHVAADRPGASKRDSSVCATAIANAEAEFKKGNFKSARQSYQAALTADPLSYPAALGLARTWEKTDVTKQGQTRAFENYRLACSLHPSAVSTFITTGTLAMKLGYYAQAVEIYSRAVAANPNSLDAIDGLIRALGKTNKATVAKAYQSYRNSIPVRRK